MIDMADSLILAGMITTVVLLALLIWVNSSVEALERREKAREERMVKAFKDIYSALGYSIEDAECRAVIRARKSARTLRGRGA